jgi:hypothetical protein
MNNTLSPLLLLAPLTLAACAEFEFPEILGDWDLATSTRSDCTDPANDGATEFDPCVEGSTETPCKRLNFLEEPMEVGYATVSENGSAFGSIFAYTIDATTVSFAEMDFSWSASGSALTLVDQAPDEDGCTLTEDYTLRAAR